MIKGIEEKRYITTKKLLVCKQLNNNMMRLVKINKGEKYNYKLSTKKYVFLAKGMVDDVLKDVLKMPLSDFKKYFKEIKI